jgi:hypothetical protein
MKTILPDGQRCRPLRLTLAFATLLTLSSCLTRSAAHYGTHNVIPKNETGSYRLAVVELGEFGSYRERQQIDNAVNLIADTERPLLVTYIHGWHNDVTSKDVARFKGFLSRLSQAGQVRQSGYKIIGVYLAWPGESFRIPVLNTFSFWGRKRTAERIASNSDCLDSILELSRAARRHSASHTVLLGHSFGGLILERTVAHTIQTFQGQQEVKPPWDLAIVLNPASDAVLARQMISSLNQLSRQHPRSGILSNSQNQPLVVELSSENDRATGLTFPIGASLGAFIGGNWAWNQVDVPGDSEQPRPPMSERKFYLSTPGNNPYLINYAVAEMDSVGSVDEKGDAFNVNLLRNRDRRIFFTSAERNAETAVDAATAGERAPVSTPTKWRRWQIRKAGKVDGRYEGNAEVPFWIVRVPTDIIDNHGGIWSDNSMALMAAIFRMRFPLGSARRDAEDEATEQREYLQPQRPANLPAKTYPARERKG